MEGAEKDPLLAPPQYQAATAPPQQQQQYSYPPAGTYAPPAGTVVYQPQPQMFVVSFGDSPMQMQCPFCQNNVRTVTTDIDGSAVWLAFAGLCLIGCWCGCCLIPFATKSLKDVKHTCPQCNNTLGIYARLH